MKGGVLECIDVRASGVVLMLLFGFDGMPRFNHKIAAVSVYARNKKR